MRASLETNKNGMIALHLDSEAARAVFASVLFASRFHEDIAPLAGVAQQGLRINTTLSGERIEPACQ